MDKDYEEFYQAVLDDLISTKVLDKQMSILVVCGAMTDKVVLQRSGFQDVVISNLDTPTNCNEFKPFRWSFQDAEKLAYKDNSFEFVVVHEGLHHCSSPHCALLEMYRVAKKGLLLFEPYDNFLTRLGVRSKVGQEYEHAAVFYNDFSCGGVRNSSIPNYIYRWTESEIIKSISSYAPYGQHRFQFIHRMSIPRRQLKGRKNKLISYIVLLLSPFLKLLNLFLSKQSNNFAAVVLKPELPHGIHPWLVWNENGIQANQRWIAKRYGEKR